MNSWLPSIRCSVLTAMARAIETASVSPSIVTTRAGKTSWRRASREKSGRLSGGIVAESAPTVGMSVTLSPPARRVSTSAATLPTTSARIMCTWGSTRRRTIPASTVTPPTATT